MRLLTNEVVVLTVRETTIRFLSVIHMSVTVAEQTWKTQIDWLISAHIGKNARMQDQLIVFSPHRCFPFC